MLAPRSKSDTFPAFRALFAHRLEGSATPRLDTLLLVLIAGVALIMVRADAAWNPASMAVRAVSELTMVVVVALVLRRRARSLPMAGGLVAIAVCGVGLYPFLAEFALRQFAGGSEPPELLMLTSLQLASVVLAVFSCVPRLGGSAVLLSSFLLLFVTTMSSTRSLLVLAGVYGVMALWWLMGAYWDRLAGVFVASTVERRIPVRLSVLGGTVLVLIPLVAIVGTAGGAGIALSGFLPTSGGTRGHDPHARAGVGDGDAMVAAKEDAMSFGPVESELFLDSEMPTLYDMFNDMYGEPPTPKKKQERNIGLAPGQVQETERQIAKTERSGREFSAVRRRVERKQQMLDDRTAPAMLYLVGRMPLHLALERFDTFDGRVWTHSGERQERPPIRIETHSDRPWANLMRVGSSPIHCGFEPHAVKIINLKTNRFPSPPQLTAVHVDKVDRLDFFGWSDDGVICMPVRDHIPQLTVAHLRSQCVNLESLRERPTGANQSLVAEQQEGSLPHEWTRNVTGDWRQVEAVVDRLRTEFVYDPLAPAPEDCPNVVDHFLRTQRGPAYLFATTAAVLLRELGYETRLVTGFYARRDRYDHRSGQTSVLANDGHVWVEVHAGGGTWVALEPTPGFEPPRELLTWRQWAMLMADRCAAWLLNRLGSIFAAAALVALLIITRRSWLDAFARGVCRLLGLRSTRARLAWTIRLIEWRAWLSGRTRSSRSTVASWYAPLIQAVPDDNRPLFTEFLTWTDRLLYSPTEFEVVPYMAIDRACRSAVSVCTCKRIASTLIQSTGSARR